MEEIFAQILEWDGALLLWLREACVHPALDGAMRLLSRLGDGGALWITLAAIFLLAGVRKKIWRRRGYLLLFSLAANAIFCNLLLKPLFHRTRPYDLLGYAIDIPALHDPSFPSGHTSASFAAATAIYAMDKRWGILAYLIAGWMGFSRLYLGVHFPLDVLAGALLGTLAAKLTLRAMARFFPEK